MYKTDPVFGGILLGHEESKLMLIHYAKEYAKKRIKTGEQPLLLPGGSWLAEEVFGCTQRHNVRNALDRIYMMIRINMSIV